MVFVDRLWPLDGAHPADEELESLYDYPAELDRTWLRVNFVTSLDGAVAVNGSSRGLSSPADQRVLTLIRDLSDVVLVGLGTAVAEGYPGIRDTEARSRRRARFGLSKVPPIAVVTRTCALDAESPLLTDTVVPPIVVTCDAAPGQRTRALSDLGADVIVAGDGEIDLRAALTALDRRGLRRVGCEGGPTLFGALVAEDLVDELCLTVSPQLAGSGAGRIAAGPVAAAARRMRLLSAVRAEESLLLLRYGRLPE
ncbi:pyrimidine reductase family protein [Allosaccharopolyspora coralli]|uniref:Pyrimidine reductase family protein n=1 Tax=Allosaccharopolyspora coralli TaxID=2665642 RepID=A0A5Q3Q4I9_9PSEU|nr:pyrimidine reductase family protein [Allosaccharopolyspora coralli]QGK69531.1 pyrimidine reductase family protein [Allosaccharopolyspora coralli]